jgi:hypothetical protein
MALRKLGVVLDRYAWQSLLADSFGGSVFCLIVLGWCISSCGVLTLPNNLFFTQIIQQSIIYSPLLFTTAPNVRVGLDPTLQEIRRFGREEFVEPILELSVVVEGNSTRRRLLERDRKRW